MKSITFRESNNRQLILRSYSTVFKSWSEVTIKKGWLEINNNRNRRTKSKQGHICPKCESEYTKTYSTKDIIRYHKCHNCNNSFKTIVK